MDFFGLLRVPRSDFIRKKNGKYYVMSEDGKNLGGPYDTEEQAGKRLQQVEYFKHKGGK